MVKLFPEYLDVGSGGPAVAALQLILVGCNLSAIQPINGIYGYSTVESVKKLQHKLGVEADGNFGPDTRRAFAREFGCDVNQIDARLFMGETKEVRPEET